MKPIIIDFLRRWKWVYISASLLQFLVDLIAPPSKSLFSLFTIIYCGSMLLSFDLARGTARVFRALPLTCRDLANGWRFLGILAPLILFAANLAVASALRFAFGLGEVASFSQATFWLAFALLWLGTSFHILTHMPGALPQGSLSKTKAGIVGGLWGASIGGGFLFFMKMPQDWDGLQPWHWAFMAGGMISTLLGWLRAEEMAVQRTSPARACENGSEHASSHKVAAMPLNGAEGLSFLLRIVASNTIKTTGASILVFMAFQTFLRRQTQENWLTAATRIVQDPVTFYIMAPLVMITGMQWLAGIRHFRTLPLKGGNLTLMVCGLFILPAFLMLAVMGLVEVSLGTHVLLLDWLSRSWLMTAPVLLAPGLLLRLGLSSRSVFLVLTPLFASAPLAGLLAPHISGPVGVAICVLGWAVGVFLINRSICARSETYRQSLTWPMRGVG